MSELSESRMTPDSIETVYRCGDDLCKTLDDVVQDTAMYSIGDMPKWFEPALAYIKAWKSLHRP